MVICQIQISGELLAHGCLLKILSSVMSERAFCLLNEIVPVPKSGDLSDSNKWRGVMLMDVCSKIFSLVMNGRAFCQLIENGTRFQFGSMPELRFLDGLFVLKNLPSYVAFVNLIKAYDMANHELLLLLLKKNSPPPCFVSSVGRMYQNLVVVLKIEKEVQEFSQTVGVLQGGPGPVLLLDVCLCQNP